MTAAAATSHSSRRAPRPGLAAGSMAMSANPAGDTATSRPLPAAPGAPSTTRGPTVGVAPTTARAEQDLVDQGYGEAGRDFLAETQLPEDVTADRDEPSLWPEAV